MCFGSGGASLLQIRLYFGSTFHTISFRIVVFLPPILPAIFLPFQTRVANRLPAAPPIEPCERCVLLVPWLAPCPLNPHRFIGPEKPLPRVTPCTSTCCPGTKWRAVMLVPTGSSASGVRGTRAAAA